jgi:4'-phosphopantetheinyl transferase
MPVIFEKQIDTAKKLAVWHITESDTKLFEICSFERNLNFSEKRNRELAVSSILLNYLTGFDAHTNLTKDNFGKPFLKNLNISVSFSHSNAMVACIIDINGHPVGIDIERIRESIRIIAKKFCTLNDTTTFDDLRHYHLIWGGKEVLYKIFAKKELDFKEHLTVNFDSVKGSGKIRKDLQISQHELGFEWIENYILVWGA